MHALCFLHKPLPLSVYIVLNYDITESVETFKAGIRML